MLPARDRITKLYIYSTEADMLANTNGTEYTQGIVDGSQRFEHTFFSAFPSFGEANAAMYECEIAGTGDLTGKYIRVKYCYYATNSTSTRTERWLFAGKVDKCTYDRNKTARSVTAYDKLYELRTVDISAWWTTYWAAQTANRTYAQFLADMCTAFGVITDWGNLTDASASIIYTAAQNIKLSGCSFVDMLHYIGQLSRYSFFMRENGKLGRTYMHNNISQTNIDSVVDATETEYGDEPLAAYAAVMAYDGADVIYTHGSGSPTWTIRDNPLLKGKTTAQIATELDALLPKLAVTAGYYPLDAEVVVSSPDVLNISYDNLTNIRTTDGNLIRKHVIGSIELWGSQLINQRIVCPSEMERGDSLSPSMSAALSEIQKMGVEMTYKVNADNVIEAVNMEASDTVKINASAVNINGAISANGNTKINTDGTLEAVNGKFSGQLTSQTGTIGGFNLANNKIYKRSGATPAEAQYHNGVEIISDYEPAIAIGGRTGGLTPQGETEVVQILQNRFGISVERGYDEGGDAGGDFYPEYSTQLDGEYISITDGDNETYIDPTSLYIGGKDILRTHQSLVGGWGTVIPANANLNTVTYLKVGRYCCPLSASAASLSNCPTDIAFSMSVYVPFSSNYDDESAAWTYRVQRIFCYNGSEYVRLANTNGSGVWQFGNWRRVVDTGVDEYLRLIPHLIAKYAPYVASGANLNTQEYLKIGEYNFTTAVAQSCSAYLPVATEGRMTVYSPTATTYNDEGGTWKYRVREYETYNGRKWRQFCQTAGTAGSWTFGAWVAVTTVDKDSYSNTNVKSGGLSARRQNNVVSVISSGDATSIPASTWTLYVTMASKYAPSDQLFVNLGNNANARQFARFDTNGKVYLYSTTAITQATNFAFSVTYIVD